MRVSVAVMAHPARRKSVDRLLGELGHDVPVSWDTEGPPSSNAEKRWRNGVDAWRMADQSADWHLVIQDDALPCRDLISALPTIMSNIPGRGPVSLYLGAGAAAETVKTVKLAIDEQATFVGLPLIGWGVAIAAPVSDIDAMLAACDQMHGKPYDMRIGLYWKDQVRVPAWFTWPSLVQHDMTQRSLVGHVGSHRLAQRSHRTSAHEIDWSSGFVVDERAQRLMSGR